MTFETGGKIHCTQPRQILEDSPQNDRVKYIIEGSSPIDGLLALVKNNQNSDSCRAYQV